MKKRFSESLPTNPNFSAIEKEILAFWNEKKIFEKSLRNHNIPGSPHDYVACDDNKEFVFYDGPPFANGLPHYGHLLTSCVKDTIGRFQTMNGKHVERVWGWDCHGLPAEMAAEKALKVSGRLAIQQYGIDKFNQYCQNDVMKYSEEWKKYINRIGRWVDMENAYKTMDINFMESILWAFKTLYDKGLVYEEMRVMPYSWACQTPLSNFETRLDNSYRQKESKSVIVKFELNQVPAGINAEKAYLLVWTTTPWTLPSNLALAINQDLEYDYAIKKSGICTISANFDKYAREFENQLSASANPPESRKRCIYSKDYSPPTPEDEKNDRERQAFKKIKGSKLVGISYKPLFPYFISKASPKSFHIYHADFVTAEDGTGIVHIAPGFGEDDFEMCKREKIGIQIFDEMTKENRLMPAVPVDDDGCFTAEVTDFAGMHVFDANDKVIIYLKNSGNWVKTDQYLHQYPHCWRTDTPIIYKAMPSFYIAVSKYRDRLCELNQEINWIPETIKDGMFGNWLKDARDWAISRNRFFGTPLPVWKSTDSNYPCIKVFGSIKELEEFFGPHYEKTHGKKLVIDNLHRPFIDELIAPNPNDPSGESMLKRIADVFDCWFESGAMPFAEVHYPFNKKSYRHCEEERSDDNRHCEESEERRGNPLMAASMDRHATEVVRNDGNKNDVVDNAHLAFNPLTHPPLRLPADFIVEYTAQTRGWFYTLMVLSTLIFDKIPFKNCICHGVILDDKGQKLSKRLGNYIDPLEAMEEYGADALRYVMLSSTVMIGGELLIDKEGKMLAEALRLVQKPIWSALNFFMLYAREDQPEVKLLNLKDEVKEYDLFIIYRALELNIQIYNYLSNYRIADAYATIRDFIDDLNNLYIRRNRDRFWGSAMDESKLQAYNALYSALHYFSIAIAPLMPFFAEMIYQIFHGKDKSVHMENIIVNDELIAEFNKVDRVLFDNMKLLKKIFYTGRSLRDDKLSIRMRQPLPKCTLITNLKLTNEEFLKEQISEELNVKEVEIINGNDTASQYFTRKLKLNTKLLGAKLKNKLKEVSIAAHEDRYEILPNGELKIGEEIILKDEFFWQVEMNKKFENNAAIVLNEASDYCVIILDTNITEELMQEGMMRDIVRSIQDMRKKLLQISDRIKLYIWATDSNLIQACENYKDHIMQETLANEFIIQKFVTENDQNWNSFEEEIIENNMAIFGYSVENILEKKDIGMKLSLKKIN